MMGHRSKLDSSMGIRVGRMRVPALDDDNGISSLPRRLKLKADNERGEDEHTRLMRHGTVGSAYGIEGFAYTGVIGLLHWVDNLAVNSKAYEVMGSYSAHLTILVCTIAVH
jgi:hypothetical protein